MGDEREAIARCFFDRMMFERNVPFASWDKLDDDQRDGWLRTVDKVFMPTVAEIVAAARAEGRQEGAEIASGIRLRIASEAMSEGIAEGVALAADAIKALPPNVDKMIRDYEGDGDFVWTDVEVGILVNWIKSLDDVVLALIDAREGEADG